MVKNRNWLKTDATRMAYKLKRAKEIEDVDIFGDDVQNYIDVLVDNVMNDSTISYSPDLDMPCIYFRRELKKKFGNNNKEDKAIMDEYSDASCVHNRYDILKDQAIRTIREMDKNGEIDSHMYSSKAIDDFLDDLVDDAMTDPTITDPIKYFRFNLLNKYHKENDNEESKEVKAVINKEDYYYPVAFETLGYLKRDGVIPWDIAVDEAMKYIEDCICVYKRTIIVLTFEDYIKSKLFERYFKPDYYKAREAIDEIIYEYEEINRTNDDGFNEHNFRHIECLHWIKDHLRRD